MLDILDRHKKQLVAMRAWLNGKGYFKAGQALEYARDLETGFRKDGVTPAFDHQLSIARHVSTFSDSLLYPEDTIAAAFLHDVFEDYSDRISPDLFRAHFGEKLYDVVWVLSKKSSSWKKDEVAYFAEIAECPIASITKGC